MYVKGRKFDINTKSRIYSLIVLKGRCIFNEDMLGLYMGLKPRPGRTFYGDLSGAVDMLLYFFMNDEVSACMAGRGPLQELFDEVKQEYLDERDERMFRLAMEDIKNIYEERVDFMIGSSFLDFTVGSFSVFEFWMGRLYDRIKETDADRRVRKAECVVRQIKRYNDAKDEVTRQAAVKKIMEEGSPFMSAKGKLDHIFSKLSADYARDAKKDLEIVGFYRAQRNTVHNLGIHAGEEDLKLLLDSGEVTLNVNEPSRTNDWATSIELCYELMNIYMAIIYDLKRFDEECCVIYKD